MEAFCRKVKKKKTEIERKESLGRVCLLHDACRRACPMVRYGPFIRPGQEKSDCKEGMAMRPNGGLLAWLNPKKGGSTPAERVV